MKMYTSNYAKSYSRPSSSGISSDSRATSGGIDSGRPSTLNLSNSGGSSGTNTATNVGSSTSSSSNLPHKPTRYTPVYPTLMNPAANTNNPSKSSSYTSLTSSSPYMSYSRTHLPPQIELQLPPKGGTVGQQMYEQRHQYYQPGQRLQQHQAAATGMGGLGGLGSSSTNLSGVSSKSAQNLIDSDVFCLSCPPAEFKFSDAYRAKTLPRSGKEVCTLNHRKIVNLYGNLYENVYLLLRMNASLDLQHFRNKFTGSR